ncbi:hypothetical protein FACS189419_00950 [Planctomycetales bacterium]|nr:hypothetical protein FACS189419_00950 [Planctomycetales bacterium]
MTTQQLSNLIGAARLGNRDAFAQLVGHYQGLVNAAALNIIGDFQQAEDLAQETFLIAWRQLADLSDVQKFPAWLCGIARNCSKNQLRKQSKDPLNGAAELQDVAVNVAEQADEARLVWQRLKEIPETYREPLLMFYRHGANIADIASALDLTEEAVRQRLSRGRKLLKSEVERLVEKTLADTRPDTAFTLAVLAAIPLAATAGCSATSKSLGLLSGGTAMGSLGIVSVILACISYMLAVSAATAILVAVCFYGFWYAVKNSPTLRTRRFVIQAAIDFNLLMWAVYGFGWYWLLYLRLFNVHLPTLQVIIFNNLQHDFSRLCFSYLPMLGVFSFFVLYIILRWRKILYEDLGGQIPVSKTDAEPGDLRKMLAKTLETEYRWFANWIDGIHRLRNYFLTANGLRAKRNIAAWIIAVFLVGYAVLQIRLIWCIPLQSFGTPAERTFYYGSFIWWLLVQIIIQALFFRIVSFGMNISEDESALKNTPPHISSEHWTLEELAPQSRRRIVYNAVVLLAAIPLCMLFQAEIWNIVRKFKIQFGTLSVYSNQWNISFELGTFIIIETVLVSLAVLWGFRYPHRRFLGYVLLFLVSGLWGVSSIEWQPFSFIVLQPLCQFCFSWLGVESQNQMFRNVTMSEFYFYHCLALTWLIYSLLAAAICYGIHRRCRE